MRARPELGKRRAVQRRSRMRIPTTTDKVRSRVRRTIFKKCLLRKCWRPDEHVGALESNAVEVTHRDQVKVLRSDSGETQIGRLQES